MRKKIFGGYVEYFYLFVIHSRWVMVLCGIEVYLLNGSFLFAVLCLLVFINSVIIWALMLEQILFAQFWRFLEFYIYSCASLCTLKVVRESNQLCQESCWVVS